RRRRDDPTVALCPDSTVQNVLKEGERFAARARAKARLCVPLWNVDDVHGTVALACYEQFVTAKCHVHWLRADLDGRLPAKRRVYETHRIAVEAGDAEEAVVRRVTRDLRRLRHVLEDYLFADTAGFGVN